MAGGALRQVAAYVRKREGQERWWCRESHFFLQHSRGTAWDMQESRGSYGANNPLEVP